MAVRTQRRTSGVHPDAIEQLSTFPLLNALFGRRARRFGLGMAIPDGPLAYTSRQEPLTLSDAERTILILAGAGVSGWNFGIPHTPSGDAAFGCNYPARLTGRTYPSGAGINTSEMLITDDSGSYITKFRDLDPAGIQAYGDVEDLDELLELTSRSVVRLSDSRVELPRTPEHISGHNHWVANQPGTTLFIPIVNVSEHALSSLAINAQAGTVLFDDRDGQTLGDPSALVRQGRLNPEKRRPLADFDRWLFTSISVETGFIAYNIQLMLQAVGLGGWLYAGINGPSLLGAFADDGVPGFGFRYVRRDDWATPNPVGLDGHFEGLTPPYVRDLYEAVEIVHERRFGAGGTYDPARPGPWKDNASIKQQIERYSPEFVHYLGSVAQDVYDRYGRFPATLPSVYTAIYTQAHHLDLEYYDHFHGPEAYLQTHAEHMERWHGAGPD